MQLTTKNVKDIVYVWVKFIWKSTKRHILHQCYNTDFGMYWGLSWFHTVCLAAKADLVVASTPFLKSLDALARIQFLETTVKNSHCSFYKILNSCLRIHSKHNSDVTVMFYGDTLFLSNVYHGPSHQLAGGVDCKFALLGCYTGFFNSFHVFTIDFYFVYRS